MQGLLRLIEALFHFADSDFTLLATVQEFFVVCLERDVNRLEEFL